LSLTSDFLVSSLCFQIQLLPLRDGEHYLHKFAKFLYGGEVGLCMLNQVDL
jgi:hypothetical protein